MSETKDFSLVAPGQMVEAIINPPQEENTQPQSSAANTPAAGSFKRVYLYAVAYVILAFVSFKLGGLPVLLGLLGVSIVVGLILFAIQIINDDITSEQRHQEALKKLPTLPSGLVAELVFQGWQVQEVNSFKLSASLYDPKTQKGAKLEINAHALLGVISADPGQSHLLSDLSGIDGLSGYSWQLNAQRQLVN